MLTPAMANPSNVVVEDVDKTVLSRQPYQIEVCYEEQVPGDKSGDMIKGALLGGLLGNNIKGEVNGGAIGAVIGGMLRSLTEHCYWWHPTSLSVRDTLQRDTSDRVLTQSRHLYSRR